MINSSDSQNNYIGKWVYKHILLSPFETIYNEWIKVPPYIIDINDKLVINPYKSFFKEILDSCMSE